VSKNHRLHHKTHVDCGSLIALDGKSLISRSVNSYLLKTYYLILHILHSQYKLNLNHDMFDLNTRLVVIGVKYCQLIPTVWLMWVFNDVFHSWPGWIFCEFLVPAWRPHIMFMSSMCIIDNTSTHLFGVFPQFNSIRKCEWCGFDYTSCENLF
jgi:hypothetical protein